MYLRFVSQLRELALDCFSPSALRPRLPPNFVAETFAGSARDVLQ
jgi:hypothetical protein